MMAPTVINAIDRLRKGINVSARFVLLFVKNHHGIEGKELGNSRIALKSVTNGHIRKRYV